jgi:hypothetical protein
VEQSPSETKGHSSTQQIPRLLCNPKVHYRVHNSPPLVLILSQMHPVHTFPYCFSKLRFNIILPSAPKFSKCCIPFRLSEQKFCIHFLSLPYFVRAPYLIVYVMPCFKIYRPLNILIGALIHYPHAMFWLYPKGDSVASPPPTPQSMGRNLRMHDLYHLFRECNPVMVNEVRGEA